MHFVDVLDTLVALRSSFQCRPFSSVCAAFIIYYKTPKMVVQWHSHKCAIWIVFFFFRFYFSFVLIAINCYISIAQCTAVRIAFVYYYRRSNRKWYRNWFFIRNPSRCFSRLFIYVFGRCTWAALQVIDRSSPLNYDSYMNLYWTLIRNACTMCDVRWQYYCATV